MGCARTLFPASIVRVLSSPDDADHNAVGVGQRIETDFADARPRYPLLRRDQVMPTPKRRRRPAQPLHCISIASRESPCQSASGPFSEAFVVTPFFLPADKGNRYPPCLFVAQRRLVGQRYIKSRIVMPQRQSPTGIDVAGESRRWRIRCCGRGLRKSVSIGGDTVVLRTKGTNRYRPAIAVE